MKQRIPKYSRKSIMGLDNSHTIRTDDIGQDVNFARVTSFQDDNKTPALYTIDIPDNSLQMRLFEQNHPRLYRWLNTGLGQRYLEMQRDEA